MNVTLETKVGDQVMKQSDAETSLFDKVRQIIELYKKRPLPEKSCQTDDDLNKKNGDDDEG